MTTLFRDMVETMKAGMFVEAPTAAQDDLDVERALTAVMRKHVLPLLINKMIDAQMYGASHQVANPGWCERIAQRTIDALVANPEGARGGP